MSLQTRYSSFVSSGDRLREREEGPCFATLKPHLHRWPIWELQHWAQVVVQAPVLTDCFETPLLILSFSACLTVSIPPCDTPFRNLPASPARVVCAVLPARELHAPRAGSSVNLNLTLRCLRRLITAWTLDGIRGNGSWNEIVIQQPLQWPQYQEDTGRPPRPRTHHRQSPSKS